jgi:hypothetical protein
MSPYLIYSSNDTVQDTFNSANALYLYTVSDIQGQQQEIWDECCDVRQLGIFWAGIRNLWNRDINGTF